MSRLVLSTLFPPSRAVTDYVFSLRIGLAAREELNEKIELRFSGPALEIARVVRLDWWEAPQATGFGQPPASVLQTFQMALRESAGEVCATWPSVRVGKPLPLGTPSLLMLVRLRGLQVGNASLLIRAVNATGEAKELSVPLCVGDGPPPKAPLTEEMSVQDVTLWRMMGGK